MYLGIDLGTGSVKLMLVDRQGRTRTSSASYPIEAPKPGWAETDPQAWITAISNATAELPDLHQLRGIGFSGQMHGVVPVGRRDGEALNHAILWADQRAGRHLHHLRDLDEGVRRRLLNAPAPGLCGATLLWMKSEQPRLYDAVETVFQPKDYLRFVMTGTRATDRSDASGTALYDFERRDWCGEAIDALGLRRDFLPPIRSGVETAGRVTAKGAAIFGLPEGVPVAIGGGDAPVGMFGADLCRPDEMQVSVGTAAQVSRPIPADRLPPLNPSLNVFEGVRDGDRYRVAAMLNAGVALEWVRRLLKLEWKEIYEALAERDPAERPGALFLPYLAGERTPYMDPNPRGAWIGLGLHHSDIDLAHAALIGVACSIRLGLETLGVEGVSTIRAVGGSLRHLYWRNLLASVIGRPLAIYKQTDISALGAARIAAAQLGEDFPRETDAPTEVAIKSPSWLEDTYETFKSAYEQIRAINP